MTGPCKGATDRHRKTLGHMQAKTVKNRLAVTLEHVNAKHLATHWVMWRARQSIGDTLSNVEAYALADPKFDTLVEAKAETL